MSYPEMEDLVKQQAWDKYLREQEHPRGTFTRGAIKFFGHLAVALIVLSLITGEIELPWRVEARMQERIDEVSIEAFVRTSELEKELERINWEVCSTLWDWAYSLDYSEYAVSVVEQFESEIDYWTEGPIGEFHDGFCYWK